jgi:hypothetical protein
MEALDALRRPRGRNRAFRGGGPRGSGMARHERRAEPL